MAIHYAQTVVTQLWNSNSVLPSPFRPRAMYVLTAYNDATDRVNYLVGMVVQNTASSRRTYSDYLQVHRLLDEGPWVRADASIAANGYDFVVIPHTGAASQLDFPHTLRSQWTSSDDFGPGTAAAGSIHSSGWMNNATFRDRSTQVTRAQWNAFTNFAIEYSLNRRQGGSTSTRGRTLFNTNAPHTIGRPAPPPPVVTATWHDIYRLGSNLAAPAPPQPPPAVVDNGLGSLKVTALSATTARATWTRPALTDVDSRGRAESLSHIQGAIYRIDTDPEQLVNNLLLRYNSARDTLSPLDMSSLVPGATYRIILTPWYRGRFSSPGTTRSADWTQPAAPVPLTPANRALRATPTNLTYSWDAVEGADYQVQWRLGFGSRTTISGITGTSTTFAPAGIRAGQVYRARVRARVLGTWSGWSSESAATVPAAATWKDIYLMGSNLAAPVPLWYDIYRMGRPLPAWQDVYRMGSNLAPPEPSWKDIYLMGRAIPGYQDIYTLGERLAAWQDVYALGRRFGADLVAPENLRAVAIGETAIVMAWDPVEGATGYDLDRRVGQGGISRDISTRPGAVVRGLQRGTTYTFRVRARDGDREGPYSDTLDVTTRGGLRFQDIYEMGRPLGAWQDVYTMGTPLLGWADVYTMGEPLGGWQDVYTMGEGLGGWTDVYRMGRPIGGPASITDPGVTLAIEQPDGSFEDAAVDLLRASVRQGRLEATHLAKVQTMQMQLTLRNDEGQYGPGKLLPNRRVHFSLAGVPVARGWVRAVQPDTDHGTGWRTATVTCEGVLGRLARAQHELSLFVTDTVRTNEVVHSILDQSKWPAELRDIQRGQTRLNPAHYVGVLSSRAIHRALPSLRAMEDAELGLLHEGLGDTLHFQGRFHRELDTAPVEMFLGNLENAVPAEATTQVTENWDNVYTSIGVGLSQAIVQAERRIWELKRPVLFAVGDTMLIDLVTTDEDNLDNRAVRSVVEWTDLDPSHVEGIQVTLTERTRTRTLVTAVTAGKLTKLELHGRGVGLHRDTQIPEIVDDDAVALYDRRVLDLPISFVGDGLNTAGDGFKDARANVQLLLYRYSRPPLTGRVQSDPLTFPKLLEAYGVSKRVSADSGAGVPAAVYFQEGRDIQYEANNGWATVTHAISRRPPATPLQDVRDRIQVERPGWNNIGRQVVLGDHLHVAAMYVFTPRASTEDEDQVLQLLLDGEVIRSWAPQDIPQGNVGGELAAVVQGPGTLQWQGRVLTGFVFRVDRQQTVVMTVDPGPR